MRSVFCFAFLFRLPAGRQRIHLLQRKTADSPVTGFGDGPARFLFSLLSFCAAFPLSRLCEKAPLLQQDRPRVQRMPSEIGGRYAVLRGKALQDAAWMEEAADDGPLSHTDQPVQDQCRTREASACEESVVSLPLPELPPAAFAMRMAASGRSLKTGPEGGL